jgi:hypothetical protein
MLATTNQIAGGKLAMMNRSPSARSFPLLTDVRPGNCQISVKV